VNAGIVAGAPSVADVTDGNVVEIDCHAVHEALDPLFKPRISVSDIPALEVLSDPRPLILVKAETSLEQLQRRPLRVVDKSGADLALIER
jgi:hypothetical protein